MSNVESLVKSTLMTLGVPVARLMYQGKADTFMTYQRITRRPTQFSDDAKGAYEYLLRVDIYSKKNHLALLERVEHALEDADFYGIIVNPETYEDDTELYHVPIEFYYTLEV